jgi:hypothetical protein
MGGRHRGWRPTTASPLEGITHTRALSLHMRSAGVGKATGFGASWTRMTAKIGPGDLRNEHTTVLASAASGSPWWSRGGVATELASHYDEKLGRLVGFAPP